MLATLALLVLPGAALIRRQEWERADPIELAAACAALSVASWAVALWVLKLAPVSFRFFGLGIIGVSAAVLVVRRRTLALCFAVWRRAPRPPLLSALFVAGILALRFAFAWGHLGFSGGDMTAHAALTELIVMTDGFPRTQEPLLPAEQFGQVAPGFHAVSALVTLLSGVPAYRSTILVMCAAAAALTFSLYALLRGLEVAPWPAAAGAGGALLMARNPQFFMQWGGAPMLLALAVVFFLLRDALRLGERCDAGFLARTGFLAAGTLLTHPLPAVSAAYVLGVAGAVRVLTGKGTIGRFAVQAAAALGLALLLSLPFLSANSLSVPPRLELWAHGWFREEARRAVDLQRRLFHAPRAAAGASTWPFYLVVFLGVLPTVLLFAGLARRWWKDRGQATLVATAILGVCLLLFAGGLREFLPFWPALYPTRTSAWLAVPLAAALAALAEPLARLRQTAVALVALDLTAAFVWEGWQLRRLEFGIAFYEEARAGRISALSIAAHEMSGGAFWIATRTCDNAALTGDDVAAFAWVRRETPESSVFANNPGDGGGLLPAQAHRMIRDPHLFVWEPGEAAMAAWRAKAPASYVYTGARPSPAWPRPYRAEELSRDAGVEEVFRSGQARVFRIRDPFDPRFR